MQVSERIADLKRRYADLDDEMALVSKLPEGLDISTMFTLHGHWHVNVTNTLAEALTLLPPANAKMALRDGTWDATPENAPVSWTQRVLPLLKTTGGVHWHHYLEDGICLSVKVADAGLPDVPGYTVATSYHADVLVRKVRQPAITETSPEEKIQAEWDAFYANEGYRAHQKQFAGAFQAAARRNIPLSMAMLPIPAATTMEVAGESLQVLHGGVVPAETLPEGSALHALPRIGRFWSAFTKEQAQRLVDFANERCKELEGEQVKAVRAGFERAKAALARLEEQYLQGPVANGPDSAVLTHWVQKETGLPVSVGVRESLTYRKPGEYEIWLQLWRFHESGKLTVPSNVLDPAGFDFQNPPFYEYEDNAGQF